MSKALDANHAGILHALQQLANSTIHVMTDEDVDRLGSDAALNTTVAAGLNHHEKKFLFRAAKFNDLAYITGVTVTAPSPIGHLVHEAAANDLQLEVTWSKAVTHAGATPNIPLTFDNSNSQVAAVTAGNGTNKWTCTYSTQLLDTAASGLSTTSANIALNGATITDNRGRNAGLNFVEPIRLTDVTVGA